MIPRVFYPWLRAVALVTLAAFLVACTRNEIRGSVDEQHIAVDWAQVGAKPREVDGLVIRGIILSPAQWPLEASVKHALRATSRA